MRKVLHVHQALMRQGKPALICRTYKGSTHHGEIKVLGPSTLVQSATPDSCGAKITIRTDSPVEADGVLIR